MKIVRHGGPAEFRQAAHDFLVRNEAMNSKFFGVIQDAIGGRYGEKNLWLTIEQSGEVQGAAVQTQQGPLAVAFGSSRRAVEGLVAEASRGPKALERLRLPVSYAYLLEGLELDFRQTSALGAHELLEVVQPSGVCGGFRRAIVSDLSILTDFARGFASSTGAIQKSDQNMVYQVRGMLESGSLAVWEYREAIVSMAAARGPTPRGIRISWVYTPPEHRGNGFASALVAALSQCELDAGRDFCFLFTDLANSKSNKIYKRIGYRRVGEIGIYEPVF